MHIPTIHSCMHSLRLWCWPDFLHILDWKPATTAGGNREGKEHEQQCMGTHTLPCASNAWAPTLSLVLASILSTSSSPLHTILRVPQESQPRALAEVTLMSKLKYSCQGVVCSYSPIRSNLPVFVLSPNCQPSRGSSIASIKSPCQQQTHNEDARWLQHCVSPYQPCRWPCRH